MSEMSDRKSPERRLRFFRFGLLAVTGVAFALGATLDYLAWGASDLFGAVMQGVIYGAIAGVLSVIIYFVYKAFVVKPE